MNKRQGFKDIKKVKLTQVDHIKRSPKDKNDPKKRPNDNRDMLDIMNFQSPNEDSCDRVSHNSHSSSAKSFSNINPFDLSSENSDNDCMRSSRRIYDLRSRNLSLTSLSENTCNGNQRFNTNTRKRPYQYETEFSWSDSYQKTILSSHKTATLLINRYSPGESEHLSVKENETEVRESINISSRTRNSNSATNSDDTVIISRNASPNRSTSSVGIQKLISLSSSLSMYEDNCATSDSSRNSENNYDVKRWKSPLPYELRSHVRTSHQFRLPTLPHPTNNSNVFIPEISPETLIDIISGRYRLYIPCYTIFDCRYPYEYKGGHIAGAYNLFTYQKLIHYIISYLTEQSGSVFENTQSESFNLGVEKWVKQILHLLKNIKTQKPSQSPPNIPVQYGSSPSDQNNTIHGNVGHRNNFRDFDSHTFIFYCEFSSFRAPRIAQCLRGLDKIANKEIHPRIKFPNIYILHGGYNEFYSKYKEYCKPCDYIAMKQTPYSLRSPLIHGSCSPSKLTSLSTSTYLSLISNNTSDDEMSPPLPPPPHQSQHALTPNSMTHTQNESDTSDMNNKDNSLLGFLENSMPLTPFFPISKSTHNPSSSNYFRKQQVECERILKFDAEILAPVIETITNNGDIIKFFKNGDK